MIRLMMTLALTALISMPAMARDDGGFGSSFTNKVPSALAETPNSTIAQTSKIPAEVAPDGQAMQEIMPAAGDEQDMPPAEPDQLTPDAPTPVTTPAEE